MSNRASARLRFALRFAGLPAVALCRAAAASFEGFVGAHRKIPFV